MKDKLFDYFYIRDDGDDRFYSTYESVCNLRFCTQKLKYIATTLKNGSYIFSKQSSKNTDPYTLEKHLIEEDLIKYINTINVKHFEQFYDRETEEID